MDEKNKESYLMKGSEVISFLGLKATAGYRYLQHLERHQIIRPIKLPGLKTPRWKKEEIVELANTRDAVECPEFVVNQNGG
jgi:predicted DNA-binding transcriptional regulator AlpA